MVNGEVVKFKYSEIVADSYRYRGARQHRPRGPSAHRDRRTNPAALSAVGSGKINSNRARPMDSQTASPSPPADLDSDVMLAASIDLSMEYGQQ